jgi:hypothetical protein
MKAVVCKIHPNVVGLPFDKVHNPTNPKIVLLNLNIKGDETIKKMIPIIAAMIHFS